ncbi:MAG: universal stress protein [Hyphomicrobiales bacterium]
MFKTIVVAVDGSAPSENALLTACDIAKKYDAAIHLVHSPELDPIALAMGSGAFSIDHSSAEVKTAGRQIMVKAKELAQYYGCEPAECHINNGSAAEDILKHAKKADADLIVAGRRGLGNLTGLFMGSVSQKIAQEAKCACMTVT